MSRGRTLKIARSSQAGFTLIEVMIAVLVLAFGLLGFALLQTMSVRFAQSANFRTQATNLTYELLDQIRINRVAAASYAGDYEATIADADCVSPTGSGLSTATFMKDWRCRLGKALGENATAKVERNGDVITVTVAWGDERWSQTDVEETKFTARTRL